MAFFQNLVNYLELSSLNWNKRFAKIYFCFLYFKIALSKRKHRNWSQYSTHWWNTPICFIFSNKMTEKEESLSYRIFPFIVFCFCYSLVERIVLQIKHSFESWRGQIDLLLFFKDETKKEEEGRKFLQSFTSLPQQIKSEINCWRKTFASVWQSK